METNVLLSIIMPCYNVEETIERALDSILMQQTTFEYEVLLVDDCSTDSTSEIFSRYAKEHSKFKLISHQKNCGNAKSFYDGLCAAEGSYFCVLDGDDYYTHREKLQRQVDYLNSDVLQEYVAVAHYHIYDLCDGTVSVDKRTNVSEFTYVDFLMQTSGYYHTATYMFRNIFKGCVPEYFQDERFRGDTPRTAFHLRESNKKVKVLDFVGSAYVYNYKGIWSSMNLRDQRTRQIQALEDLRNMSHTSLEVECYNKRITAAENWSACTDYRSYKSESIEFHLDEIRRYTGILAFSQREFIFEGVYYSQYVDSLCASLGYIHTVYHPESVQTKANSNRIAIVIGLLNPHGGGIFGEIMELADIYDDRDVMILLTNSSSEQIPELALNKLNNLPNVTVRAPSQAHPDKLNWLFKEMATFSPAKAYFYTSHNDPYAQAIMQSSVCKNICLFSFDHGFLCGISNPNLDIIIAKRPLDYAMLKKRFGGKAIYIPTWSAATSERDFPKYEPFKNHTNLITASGAARYYKLSDKPPFSYTDMVLELLTRTGGKHYHFGPIPAERLEYIQSYLLANGLSIDSFVHIEWADNLIESLIKYNVDIFLEPFPVVSYKMTLTVISAGIPVLAQHSTRRISQLDFIYSKNLLWRNVDEFYNTLLKMTKEQLLEHSKKSIDYFNSTHAIDVIAPYIRSDTPFHTAGVIDAIDGVLKEIRPFETIFGLDGTLDIQSTIPDTEVDSLADEQSDTITQDDSPDLTTSDVALIPAEADIPAQRTFFKQFLQSKSKFDIILTLCNTTMLLLIATILTHHIDSFNLPYITLVLYIGTIGLACAVLGLLLVNIIIKLRNRN